MTWLDSLYAQVVPEATSLASHPCQCCAASFEVPPLSHPSGFAFLVDKYSVLYHTFIVALHLYLVLRIETLN